MSRFRLALCIAALCGGPAIAQEIGGRYTVDGTNPNGSPYSGTAEIIPMKGGTCRMTWQVGSTSNGTCIATSRSLGAYYRSGNTTGIVVYDLEPGGVLRGVWTLGDNTGTETLTPAR